MKGLIVGLALVACVPAARADLFDLFKKKPASTNSSAASLSGFSDAQLANALKQALGNGVSTAVTNLGKPGGFLDNPRVRIPMPEKLATVEKTLRSLKQDKYADEFVTTMNRAAEAAVPAALPIFTEALQSMTIDDAKKLVSGGKDSGTQFFKTKGEKQIQEKMMPIIKESTAKTGVTSAYKKLLDQAGGGGSFLGKIGVNTSTLDVDSYVTQKASDGLFKMIAEEEERIRANPAARTTQLLEKVFGAVK
jgi:hypothetical protein